MMENVPKVTKNIIIINVIVFIGTCINNNAMTAAFALFYPASPYFHFWQIVTYMFMHGGVWHIFFNMYTLFVFGSVLERMIGERNFLIFYFICGIGAALAHIGVQYLQLLSNPGLAIMAIPTVGASGAIYGVLIGYAMLFPDSRLTLIFPPVSLSAKWMVVVFAAIELLTGVTGTADGIAHFAHLGGMIFGYVLIKIWRSRGTLFPDR